MKRDGPDDHLRYQGTNRSRKGAAQLKVRVPDAGVVVWGLLTAPERGRHN